MCPCTLRVVPRAEIGVGELVRELHAKSAPRDSFTVVNGVARSDEEVDVVDFILKNASALA